MANESTETIAMSNVVIGGNTYEITDKTAREDCDYLVNVLENTLDLIATSDGDGTVTLGLQKLPTLPDPGHQIEEPA